MSDPSSRMLRLLSLLQTYRYWSGQELADRLEVTPRTLRRDVDRLRELGYPVHATRGATGGYRLDAGGQLPPLLFDDEEAVAIAVGLRTSAGGMVSGMEETSLRTLAKLEQVLPSRLRRRVNALQAYTVPLTYAGGPTVDPKALTVIAQACRDQERLRFAYRTRDEVVSKRHVEPHRLVSAGRRWYLVAYDLERDDWRTFRVDRLERALATGARFTPKDLPGGDAAEFVRGVLDSAQQKFTAVLTVHASASVVRPYLPVRDAELEAIDDSRCQVTMTAESVEWLAMSIGMWGVDVDVHEPPELVARIQLLHERLGRATLQYTQRGNLARSMALMWGPAVGLVNDAIGRAIAVADADGLAAVTLRGIADDLSVDLDLLRTHLPGKAELLDAMVDHVMSEIDTGGHPAGGWRAALGSVAQQNWLMFRRHPWLLQVVTVHPPLGPNLMAKYEHELSAVENCGLTDVEMDAVVTLVLSHALATARTAVDADQTAQRTGSTDDQWWTEIEPLLGAVVEWGAFPLASRVGSAAAEDYQGIADPEHAFTFGLERILDGVEQLMRARDVQEA